MTLQAPRFIGVTDLERSARRASVTRKAAAVAVLIATGVMGPAAHAQTLMQPNVSVAQARKIVDAVIRECSAPGALVTVTVAVVDRAGQPVMEVRADTAALHNWELAYRKAYTARTFRRNTLEWRDRTAGDSQLSGQRMLAHVIPLGGGVPIMMGDQAIGAVGVSGTPGGQESDSACAEAGVAAIAAELRNTSAAGERSGN